MEFHKISFTKFLEVKSPLGLNQKDKKTFPDVGLDLYFPRFNMNFINEIIKVNNLLPAEIQYGSRRETPTPINTVILKNKKTNSIVLRGVRQEKTDEFVFEIFDNVQIPTGLGFLIPHGYYFDLRSKSSNFKNGYTSVTGLIDENYTFSCGVQIIPLASEIIKIAENEKFAQLTLHKSYFVEEFNEIPLNEWEINKEVSARRENRSGGFGSTGKFD